MKTAAQCALAVILGLLLLVWAGVAAAAPRVELKAEGITVVLHDDACTAPKVVARLKPEYLGQFRKAVVIYQGTKLAACWTVDESAPGMVFVIDETGDNGGLPQGAFKPVGVGI